MGIHKPFGGYRRALFLGASLSTCVILSVPSYAQNALDPFSPATVAPTEPSAAPNAPTPKARYIPDPTPPARLSAPQPAPVQAVESAPLDQPLPVSEQVTAPATPAPMPVLETPPVKTAAPITPTRNIQAEPEPSFWDKFTNIFKDDKSGEKPNMFKEKAKAEQREPQPAQQDIATEKTIETPAPEPQKQVVEQPAPIITVAPTAPTSAPVPAPTPTPTPVQAAVQIPQVNVQGDPNNPFTSANIAPATPTAVPDAPQPEPIQLPVRTMASDTAVNNDLPSTTAQAEAVVEKALEETTSKTTQSSVQESLTQDTQPEPSFWNKLGNLFKSEEPDSIAVEKVEAPAPAEQTTPSLSAPKQMVEEPTVEDNTPGLFSRIGNFFSNPFSSTAEEETTPAASPIPVQKDRALHSNEPEIQNLSAPKEADPRLIKAELGLGRDIKLGQSDNDLSKQARCFTKNRGTVAFCTTPTRWPNEIAKHFDVSTHLYKGARGIVQFDGAIATRLFALFKSSGFDEIVAYYEHQYGPATNIFVRDTRLLKKDIENKSVIWLKTNASDGLTEVMEIRQFSDMRGPRTDTENGTIRVYFEGSREIFSLTSDLDYMKLR